MDATFPQYNFDEHVLSDSDVETAISWLAEIDVESILAELAENPSTAEVNGND